jgi:dolichol-phosphate mannosyltransferase
VNTDFFLSIVVPVFNEQGNIAALMKRLMPVVGKYRHEIIFIDDGSQDETVREIEEIAQTRPEVKVVSFTRNFGHQIALSAGYHHARGDCVVSIDADLQDPPEVIDNMLKQWRDGAKIVYARRKTRKSDSMFKKISAWGFYWFINKLSEIQIPMDVGDFRLLDQVVVRYLNSLPEHAKFLRGLVAWSGYRTAYVEFDRESRHSGETHYPLRKMLNFALTGITAFSVKPLRVVTCFGFGTAALGFLGMTYALIQRLFLPHQYWVTGWTAIFVSIMFFSGVQMLILGIIGEYIGRIFGQVQSRPLYLVKKRINIE